MNKLLGQISVGKKLLLIGAFFATVLVGMVMYTVATLGDQKADSVILNIAGRERMLTQKFTKEVLEEISLISNATSLARAAAAQIAADRSYYVKNVILKLKRDWPDFKASVNHAEIAGAIPPPATFVREVGESMDVAKTGFRPSLLSKYNINKSRGLSSDFDKKAWNALSGNPDKAYTDVLAMGEGVQLQYAEADLSLQGCANCHNAHPDSPKHDFKAGDLMGILKVAIPITSDPVIAKKLLSQGNSGSVKTARLFEVSLAALRHGGETFTDLGMNNPISIPANINPEIEEQLAVTANFWGKLKLAVTAMRAASVGSGEFKTQANLVRQLNINTLKNMNKAVGMLAAHSSGKVSNMITVEWTILAIVLLIAALFLFVVSRAITQPLNQAVAIAGRITEGNLEADENYVNIARNDELGDLMRSLESMRSQLSSALNDEMVPVLDAAKRGDLSLNIDTRGKQGFYLQLANATNEMIDQMQQVIEDTVAGLTALESGDLSQRISTQYEGDFNVIKQAANNTAEKLNAILAEEIGPVLDAAKRGDLSRNVSTDGKEGFYLQLTNASNDLIDQVQQAVEDTVNGMQALEQGNLTHRISNEYEGSFDEIKQSANHTSEKLMQVIGGVSSAAAEVATGSAEIASGNAKLNEATQQQAASLEETAASIEEMTGTIQQTADNSRQANQLATEARKQAEHGSAVVDQATKAMAGINQSSKKIADIIGVIDEIAFQTNLLALNAAVEAARAGEQGRGFAVVAGEVRSLAQRSAEAAKEIKGLINESVSSVEAGGKLVNQSGTALKEIVGSVGKVGDIIAEIAAASGEQATGVEQINKAIAQLDAGTQQNAAMVEEVSAASENLDDQVRTLRELVSVFDLGKAQTVKKQTVAAAPKKEKATTKQATVKKEPAPTTKKSAAKPAKKPVTKPVAKSDSQDDVWEEF